MRKQINIGLFGLGCVGTGLVQAIQKTPSLHAHIKTVCVKNKNKSRELPLEKLSFDPDEILQDPEINTVVELIDDSEAAYQFVTTALKNGKAVVTANKKMIAEHFQELLDLQKKHQVSLLYEAACCASIPIIRNLEEYYDNDLLESVEGIVNGSTNYILSKTSVEKISYAEALAEAQQKGYAESNPILDTGGFDAKYKLLILIAHAFGMVTKPEDLFNLGIDKLGPLELNYAREKGYKIKLVAFAEKTKNSQILSYVMPKFVKPSDKLFQVDDVFNGIETKSYFSDTQFFAGRGAGAFPTASAVLSDISALSYDYRYEYKKYNVDEQLTPDAKVILHIFFRYNKANENQCKSYFIQIQESYQNENQAYSIGLISLEQLKNALSQFPDSSAILFNHHSQD